MFTCRCRRVHEAREEEEEEGEEEEEEEEAMVCHLFAQIISFLFRQDLTM